MGLKTEKLESELDVAIATLWGMVLTDVCKTSTKIEGQEIQVNAIVCYWYDIIPV